MIKKKAMTANVVNIIIVTIAIAVLLGMVIYLRGRFDGILGIKWF